MGANEATAATMGMMGDDGSDNKNSRDTDKNSSRVGDNIGDILKQLLAPALPLLVGGATCPHYCRIQPIGNKKKREYPLGS